MYKRERGREGGEKNIENTEREERVMTFIKIDAETKEDSTKETRRTCLRDPLYYSDAICTILK